MAGALRIARFIWHLPLAPNRIHSSMFNARWLTLFIVTGAFAANDTAKHPPYVWAPNPPWIIMLAYVLTSLDILL